ncbi:MAG: sensor histidine kinase efflux regulator BaeS [Xanthomonadaceae bacterium]|nr:sensor histidine kinase efflux regulator BaeS [Xanthomonadaceae bacterium]
MRLGIATKIFLALLTTSLVVVGVMGVTSRLVFQQGFRSYLAEVEQQRLQALGMLLVEAYQEHGSWQFLRESPRQWRQLLRFAGRQMVPDADEEEGELRPLGPAAAWLPRLSLYDATGELIAGRPSETEAARRHPLLSEGETVGWLVLAPLRHPVSRVDRQFQEQQFKAGLVTAGLALLLAAAVAALLAWRLLRPVRQLAAATHALAAGDYRVRVPVESSDELGRLARDFNRLASTLERNEKLRREFMADVSHELRTPLAVLRGELEALQDGVRAPTPEALQSLQAEVLALGKLVDDLYELALADVGALAYQLVELDLVDVVASVVKGFEARCAERQLRLTCRLPAQPLPLRGDRLRLAQLLGNLLENSLRYTDPGGQLQLEVERQGQQAIISLQDSAPGVPAELLPRLFERFYRPEHSRSRAHGGAGLGLALCRSIVEAHGGSIEARPSPLGGLQVLVRLPLR